MICILDANLNTLGVLESNAPEGIPFFNDTFHLADDGTMELEFSTPYNSAISDYMQGEGYVMYKAVDDTMYLLRIISIDDNDNNGNMARTVKCENAAIGDLSRTLVRPNNYQDHTAHTQEDYTLVEYFNHILYQSGWTLGLTQVDNMATVYTMNLDSYTNVYSQVQDGVKQWNCLIEFVVKMDGFRVISKVVNLYSNRDDLVDTMFTYSIDLVGCERTVVSDQTINAICPIGKASTKPANLRLDMSQFTPVIPTQYKPDFAIHPTYPDILYSKTAFNKFGGGKLQVGLLDLPDVTDHNDLVTKACEGLTKNIKPQMQYKININTILEWTAYQQDKKVQLGDTIIVIDDSFNPAIRVQATCIEKYSSWTVPTSNYCNFGDYKEVGQKPEVTFKKQTNLVNNYSAVWADSATKVQSGNANADDGTGLDLTTLNMTYVDSDGVTRKLMSIDTTSANPTIQMETLITNSISSGANGATIASNISGVAGYNPATDEIEVTTGDDLSAALSQLPAYIYRRIIIRLHGDCQGSFFVNGFWGEGEVVIAMDTYNINGSISFIRNTCRIGLSASTGKINGTAPNTVYGNYTLSGMVNIINNTEFTFSGGAIYGNSSLYGIYIIHSTVQGSSVGIFNCKTCVRAEASRVCLNNFTGLATGAGNYGIDLYTASSYGGDGTCPMGQAGSTLAQAIRVNQGSYNGSTQSPNSGSGGAIVVPPTTVRFYPNSPTGKPFSKSWKHDILNWRTDNNYVYTGAWTGSSNYQYGFWFFQNAIHSVIAGKTVTSMKIYMTRTTDAGSSAAVPVTLRAHLLGTYDQNGSADPYNSFFSATSVVSSFTLGQSKWVDITSLAQFFNANGGVFASPAMGIGLKFDYTDQAHYAKFSGNSIIEVTYS